MQDDCPQHTLSFWLHAPYLLHSAMLKDLGVKCVCDCMKSWGSIKLSNQEQETQQLCLSSGFYPQGDDNKSNKINSKWIKEKNMEEKSNVVLLKLMVTNYDFNFDWKRVVEKLRSVSHWS